MQVPPPAQKSLPKEVIFYRLIKGSLSIIEISNMNTDTLSKEQLITLYTSGKSMIEIAKVLNCSEHKIVYWMEKYKIPRRSRSEALYLKLNPKGDPFSIKGTFSFTDMYLYGVGIGIYWGEGEKMSRNSLRVANSDPFVLITFLRFLKKICGVNSEKVRFSLICFNDSDPLEARRYWSKILEIPEEKFGKIVVIPTQGKGIYKRKSLYGVCTLTVSNTKLKAWIMNEIEKLKMPM